ncbi:hypothetical protein H2204_012925 [Knufia peltigerae]|uniref:DUF4185 domain-containing protein n=1 Tax=Knufia peltigerae TaxID=1002370 RepID=A0AA39CSH5_9EURO|nr:hypothetical protein H2204_012925 [Knufia peltigerae]
MYISTVLLVAVCLSTGAWGTPLIKRYYDFDGNGVPDLCYQVCEQDIRCLLDDFTWTTVPSEQQFHSTTTTTSAAAVDATSTSTDVSTSASSTTDNASSSTSAAVASTTSNNQNPFTLPSTTSSEPSTSSSSTGVDAVSTSSSLTSSMSTSTSSLTLSFTSTASPASIVSMSTPSVGILMPSSSSSSSSTSSSNTQQSYGASQSASSTTSIRGPLPSGSLPPYAQFKVDQGTKWNVELVGQLQFTGKLGENHLIGDKCRTGKIGDKVIWNCGDMFCKGGAQPCGFSMGPAFYGTDDVMTVNTTGINSVSDNEFVRPWSGDEGIQPPFKIWGMDTSNVVAINETHGVAYAFEIWRNGPDGSFENRGNAVASVTLGDDRPIATRVGPLLTGPDAIQLGLLAILRDGDYVYIYSEGGPSNTIVGRVAASDDVFDADNYEFLQFGTNDTWVPGIPSKDTQAVGMTTASRQGHFACGVYGSVVFNNYLNKYMILCGQWLVAVYIYTSDTPWGPWSEQYLLMNGGIAGGSYGQMIHTEYSPDGDGSDKSWYFSMGPNSYFNMFKVTFDYDD